MRLAAIDIGTNSVHMIIVSVGPKLSFDVIDREKEIVRLGTGGLDGEPLATESMTAALHALAKFRRLADAHRVDEIIAVATSATGEARNGGDFLAAIARETGIRPRIISGLEEAHLIHQAATYGVNVGAGRAVVIDLGGGSLELTLGTGGTLELARSLKLGVLRLTERFVRSDPLTAADERRLVRHVRAELKEPLAAVVRAGFDRVIGTSGTILSLGALAASGDGHGGTRWRNVRIPAGALHRLRKRLAQLDIEQRLELTGLEPRRADLIVAGAILLDTTLRRLKARELTLCDLSLREAWCSTTSAIIDGPSYGRHGILTCGAAAYSSSPSAAGTSPSMQNRSPGWRWRSLIRPEACTSSAPRNGSGSSTPRCYTTSACRSASPLTISIRTIW